MQKHFEMTTAPPPPKPGASREVGPENAILAGEEKVTALHAPVLAIRAFPHDLGRRLPDDAAGREEAISGTLGMKNASAQKSKHLKPVYPRRALFDYGMRATLCSDPTRRTSCAR